MIIFRPFHNGIFQRNFCLQRSIVKLKPKDKKSMFRFALQNIFSNNSPPKNFDNDLNLTSFVHDFNIFAHYVMEN